MSTSRLFSPQRWPLATKLASVMFVLALVPLLVVALINAQDVEAQAEQRELADLQGRAAAAGRRLEERVARLRGYVELLASNPALSEAMRDPGPAEAWFHAHPHVRDLLVSVRASDPWFQNVYLLDADGICLATSDFPDKPDMVGRSYDYRPYFRQPRVTGRPFVSDVLKNANSPGTAIFVSAPLASGGVAVLKIDTAALHDVVADLASGGGRVLMVDRFGVVVSDATPDGLHELDDPDSLQFHPLADVQRWRAQFEETKRYGEPEGDNYFARVDEPLGLQELWRLLLGNEPGARETDVPPRAGAPGEPTIVGFAPVWSDEEQPYGYVVIGEEASHFREPLRATTRTSILRMVLTFAGVAIVIALSLRGLSRRVGELAEATQRLGAGDRSIRLATTPADELGTLAASFNRLSAELADSVADLEDQRATAETARVEAERDAAVRDAVMVRVGRRLPDAIATWREAADALEDPSLRDQVDAANRDAAAHADALLALSSARPAAPHPEPVDAIKLLRAAVTRAEPLAALSQTTVELEAENQLGRITVDAARLAVVLDELLGNAARFTRHGTIRVVAERRNEDDCLTIRIADDGVGMTRGQREQLGTPQPREDGAGLGLHLAGRFAAHLGIELVVEGNPGEGTIVTLRVPLGGHAASRSDVSSS